MKRKILAVLLAVGMILALAACGGSAKSEQSRVEEPRAEEGKMAVTESMSASSSFADGVSDMVQMETPAESTGSGGNRPQKLIRTAWLELETTEFDEAARNLADLTEQFDGYYENSSISNRGNGARWGSYTVRIPAERYDAFLNQAGQLCHETWRETRQEDVSEAYYDTEGRLKTQQIKLERLQALLAQATAMEDIITIESAISETEWQIDNLSGTLRHYDGKVNYATVQITLKEVYKLSNVETVPDTFGQRLGNAFTDGMSSFADSMEDLTIFVAYNWIWLIFWGAVIVAVIVVVCKRGLPRPTLKRRAQKTDDKQDQT